VRLLVTGDRMWGRVGDKGQPTGPEIRQAKMEREYLELVLDEINTKPGITGIVVGDAKGADEFTRRWAISRKVPFVENDDGNAAPFVADWDQYGNRAGPIRNAAMLAKGEPDAAVAFHRDFLRSKGTKDMVDRLLRAGVTVSIHPSVSRQ